MKLIRLLFFAMIAIFFMQSCDKIKGPYKEKNIGGDTSQVVRKILLEEFTGHRCPNCPTASKLAHDLKDYYGNKLIIISIHTGFLAEPQSSGDYTKDFTTTTGDEIGNHYGIGAVLPVGMINRIKKNSNPVIATGDWASTIDTLSHLEQDAQLTITNDYNASTRVLNTTVKTEFFNALSGPIKICLYIIEDSIVAPQKNNNSSIGPDDILDYLHMHVLRDAINGTWGDTLLTNTADTSITYTRNFTYTLKPDWIDKHCAVVAFIYYEQSEAIIQAEEKYIK